MSRAKITVDRGVISTGVRKIGISLGDIKRIMVARRDDFGIERLLQMLQILWCLGHHQLIFNAIFSRCFFVMIIKVAGKVVVITKTLVYIVAVPEASRAAMKNSTGITGSLIENGRRSFKRIFSAETAE